MEKKIISLMLIAAVLLSGCKRTMPQSDGTEGTDSVQAPEVASAVVDNEAEDTAPEAETEAEKYEYNPHLYLPMLADDIPQDYWDSLYNLCDALRAGESTFACSSEEAYRWATDSTTLTNLLPAACTKIKGESDDGTVPFENGIGHIYYQMPVDEFVEREARFEALVADVLNTYLDPDDDDFEKCLKLYDYMSLNYSYEYEFVEIKNDGANYLAITTGYGECIELASVYAFFLMQAGVEALQVGGHSSDMDHAWTYLVLDGKGYHSDPTWALRTSDEGDELGLYYFLMTDERRAGSGFDMSDLTAALLPRYWANQSSVEFTASDDAYCFPSASFLKSIDEESKTVYYSCNGEGCEFNYAKAE